MRRFGGIPGTTDDGTRFGEPSSWLRLLAIIALGALIGCQPGEAKRSANSDATCPSPAPYQVPVAKEPLLGQMVLAMERQTSVKARYAQIGSSHGTPVSNVVIADFETPDREDLYAMDNISGSSFRNLYVGCQYWIARPAVATPTIAPGPPQLWSVHLSALVRLLVHDALAGTVSFDKSPCKNSVCDVASIELTNPVEQKHWTVLIDQTTHLVMSTKTIVEQTDVHLETDSSFTDYGVPINIRPPV